MTMTKRQGMLSIVAMSAAMVLGAGVAQAQYRNKPITMIVPFAAGGPTDVIARIVGEHMSRSLGQTVVVENVAGAGGHDRHHPRRARHGGWLHHHDGAYGHAWCRAGPLSAPCL